MDRISRLNFNGPPITRLQVSAFRIPACLSCHGTNGRKDFSHLAGQSEQYLKQQLRLLRRGVRDDSPYAAMITVVAKRMTEQQIDAAAGVLYRFAEAARRSVQEGDRATMKGLLSPRLILLSMLVLTALLVCCSGEQSAFAGFGPVALRITRVIWIMFIAAAVITALICALAGVAIAGPVRWRHMLMHEKAVIWGSIVFPAVTLGGCYFTAFRS